MSWQMYYGLDGEPISEERWSELMTERHRCRERTEATGRVWSSREDDPTRIAATTVGEYTVSTVWLGLNHEWDRSRPPLVFETMVFGGEHEDYDAWDEWTRRYSTPDQARAGHDQVVAEVREQLAHTHPEEPPH